MAVGIPFGWQVENANGVPVSGAKIYFYQPGTTTPRSAYTDDGLTVPAANPVIADSAGWFKVYRSSELGYDVVIKSADDSITYYESTFPSTIENAMPADATLIGIAGLDVTDGDYIEATGTDTFRARKLFVDTKSDLAAIQNPQAGDVITVLGRTAAGDGGGGVFRVVSDTSGNVTTALAEDTLEGIRVELTNGGGTKYAERMGIDGERSARWWGFDPDLTTDQWAVLKGIAEATINTGATIVFPKGDAVRIDVPTGTEFVDCVDNLSLIFEPGSAWNFYWSDTADGSRTNLYIIRPGDGFSVSARGTRGAASWNVAQGPSSGGNYFFDVRGQKGFLFRDMEVDGDTIALEPNTADAHKCGLGLMGGSSSDAAEDWEVCNNYMHHMNVMWLKSNTNESIQRRWKVHHNKLEKFLGTYSGINSPLGELDEFEQCNNTYIGWPLADLNGGSQPVGFFCGGVNAQNALVADNVFLGDIREAVHVEEAGRNYVIRGNRGVIRGNGIVLVENIVGSTGGEFGTDRHFVRGVCHDNVILCSDNTIPLHTDASGIFLIGSSSGSASNGRAAEKWDIHNNVMEGFEYGYLESEYQVDPATGLNTIHHNTFINCDVGARMNWPHTGFANNTFHECDTGFMGDNSGMIGFQRFGFASFSTALGTVPQLIKEAPSDSVRIAMDGFEVFTLAPQATIASGAGVVSYHLFDITNVEIRAESVKMSLVGIDDGRSNFSELKDYSLLSGVATNRNPSFNSNDSSLTVGTNVNVAADPDEFFYSVNNAGGGDIDPSFSLRFDGFFLFNNR